MEVACTNYEGVDAVKRALKKGLELTTETMPIKVFPLLPLSLYGQIAADGILMIVFLIFHRK